VSRPIANKGGISHQADCHFSVLGRHSPVQ